MRAANHVSSSAATCEWAPRARVLPDSRTERFAQVSDELESLLGLPPDRRISGKTPVP
jgi:hypothetical protein